MMFWLLSLCLVPSLAQTYCDGGARESGDTTLGYTAMFGDKRNFSDNQACPGYLGVLDLTNLWADIHSGGTYTLVYNATTCGLEYSLISGAWIDFDQNGSFDATELLFPYITLLPSNYSLGLLNASFTINPSSPIKLGMTRMRVIVMEYWGNSGIPPTSITPCSQFNYGGAKDFNISIVTSRCNSGPSTTEDANLGPVTLKGDTLTISDTIGCPGQIGPIDETLLVADLTLGENYEITYTVNTCGSIYDTLSTAWIDYDNNGRFDEWERIIPYSSQFGTNTVPFGVPVSGPNQTIVLGKDLWMRVQVQETNAASISPCSLFPYGGTKDFYIRLGGAYCKSGPTALGGITLGSVQLQGQTSNIDDASSCPGGVGPQLLLNQSADLVPGKAWVISYSVVNCGTASKYSSAAWIDFDQDNEFESWEKITPDSQSASNLFQFKVPPSSPEQQVKTGSTRLRVQVQEDSTNHPPPLDPCNNFVLGGTKDFTIRITTATSDSNKNAALE